MKYVVAKTAVALLLASLVAGQLLRLPVLGQGGGLLISDVATVLVLCAALLQGLKKHSFQNTEHKQSTTTKTQNNSLCFVICVLCFFILWSLFTLILHYSDLGSHNFLIASLYWLRLSATLLLLPALLTVFQNPGIRSFGQKVFLGSVAFLLLAGFMQILLFPDLNQPGWDPHRGRLFSTWLDPNLFGGFLVIVIPYLLIPNPSPHLRRRESEKHLSASGERSAEGRVRWYQGALLLAALIALFLTQSRSSLAALLGAVALTAPLAAIQLRRFSPRLRTGLLLGCAIAALTFALALGVFLPERVTGLFTIDETARLRLTSLTAAWQLAQDHLLLGVGYNAYQFAAAEAGFLSDFSLHSRAGSDNSWLTIMVTTGLPGLVLFLLPWAVVLTLLVRRAAAGQAVALGAAGSLVALVIHSQFVNSFLYSHLLITLIVVIALVMTNSQTPMSNE